VLAEQQGLDFTHAVERLVSSRPTAVNLAWSMQRMTRHWQRREGDVRAWLLREARSIAAEDESMCLAMGRHGAELIRDGAGVLTHCNTGALATAGLGTCAGGDVRRSPAGQALPRLRG